jgi:single-strand DNA-binding protein
MPRRFSVATSRRWKDKESDEWKEDTNWTNVVLWRAENLASYLLKGKQVYVEGRLQTRSYDDKDGKKVYATEVIAEEVVLLGGQAEGQSAGQQAARAAAGVGVGKSKASGASGDDLPEMHITDDDVPF